LVYVSLVMNLLDTLCIFVSHLHDAVCLHFAIFQPDDHYRLSAEFYYGSYADHVDAGNRR